MCIEALRKIRANSNDSAKKKIGFLLDEVLFHNVFQHIVKTTSAHQIDQTTVALSSLLLNLAKTYIKLGQITGTQSVKVFIVLYSYIISFKFTFLINVVDTNKASWKLHAHIISYRYVCECAMWYIFYLFFTFIYFADLQKTLTYITDVSNPDASVVVGVRKSIVLIMHSKLVSRKKKR